MKRFIIAVVLCLTIAFTAHAQENNYTTVVPDSLKAKAALFYGAWENKWNDSVSLYLFVNQKQQILFGSKKKGVDSITVINQGVWTVKPFPIAEMDIMWLQNPGHGNLFYHEEGDHYLFIKTLKFYYDSVLTKRILEAK